MSKDYTLYIERRGKTFYTVKFLLKIIFVGHNFTVQAVQGVNEDFTDATLYIAVMVSYVTT